MISIILPVYNGEQYIERCLLSLIKQTYKNIEIIVVDDGSKDKTKQICMHFVQNDHRIKYIYKKNSGVSSARNIGLDVSSGEFITFVDADDWLDSNYLEFMVNAATQDYDIIISSFTEDYSNYTNKRYYKKEFNNKIVDFKKKFMEDCIEQRIYTYTVWAKLYRRSVIGKERFVDLSYSEDAIFNRNVSMKANNAKFINNSGYHYFINSDSATNDKKRKLDISYGALKMIYDTQCLFINNGAESAYCVSIERMLCDSFIDYQKNVIKTLDFRYNDSCTLQIIFESIKNSSNIHPKSRLEFSFLNLIIKLVKHLRGKK